MAFKRAVLILLPLALVLLLALTTSGCGSADQQDSPSLSSIVCGEQIDTDGTEHILNGDFKSGFSDWRLIDQNYKEGEGVNRVRTTRVSTCGDIMIFSREDSGDSEGTSGIEQALELNVTAPSLLKLQIILAIDDQSLLSDGITGPLTPVYITIDYITGSGEPKSWTHGFSATPRLNFPETDQSVSPSFWYTYKNENVLAALPGAVSITRVRVGGSGWDFTSRLALVSLRSKG